MLTRTARLRALMTNQPTRTTSVIVILTGRKSHVKGSNSVFNRGALLLCNREGLPPPRSQEQPTL